MRRGLHRTAWVLVSIGAGVMFVLAARYFFLDLEAEAPNSTILEEVYLERRAGLYVHVFAMMLPLAIGPVQFLLRRLTPPSRRARYLPLHRWLGRLYVAGALVGGTAGLYLSLYAHGGFPSALGFGLLAVLTLTSTSIAFARIRAGDETLHKEWMTRSYALVFAAVMLRPLLIVYESGLGMDVTEAYQAVAWSCWVPNLIVAEAINARRAQTDARAPA